MRVGIDFGTTHTVVAAVDRGNYPVISFDGLDAWPSLIAANADGELRYGVEAAAVRHEPGWSVLRSFKRLLNDAGPQTEVNLAGRDHRLADLLTGFLAQLRRDLQHRSNATLAPGETTEAAISVPANASSAQRLLTLDAFVAAGFHVVALLNEPSAASLEYAHRYRSTITAKREYVLVYDLGGGTFDASLLRMTGHENEVVISEGIQRLGGDDFDEAIADLVLARLNLRNVDPATRELLREECAARKEAVGPQTRRFLVDLTGVDAVDRPPFSCGIDDVYSVCAPLVDQTTELLHRVLRAPAPGKGVAWSEVAGIYVVGGAGGFPLVSRMLRTAFGEKRVKRSPHPFAATAIGLAVFLDKEAGFALSERFSRHFGVFREAQAGSDVVFDPIVPKDASLPGDSPLVVRRTYRAAHNIGHFRFVECSRLVDGRPDGDVTPYDPVLFPFDPALYDRDDLGRQPVGRWSDGPDVEERYVVAPSGAVEVTLTTHPAGFKRTFRLERCAAAS